MKKRTRKLLKALMQEIIELRARVRVLEGRLRNLKIASGKGSRVVLLKRQDAFAVIRDTIGKMNMVALGRALTLPSMCAPSAITMVEARASPST